MAVSSARTARIAHAVDAAEVERGMSFADGALGAAGHEVTDPKTRDLARQVAAGTLTADEAVALTIVSIS